MSNSVHTYTGVWTNWSHGTIRGATLTLPQASASVLTAFLAVFVTSAGGYFWNIVSFALHQIYTTEPSQRRDLLHYQRQVIFRNSGTGAGAAASELIKLIFENWTAASRPIARLLPFSILALVVTSGFTVASILSSYITSAPDNIVLIRGPRCGGYQWNDAVSEAGIGVAGKMLADNEDAETYVRQCYGNSSSELACKRFVRTKLPFTTQQNVSCPFASGLCMYNDQSALLMDTGLLDSHEDFGINAPPSDRIKYRHATTCAPIYGRPFAGTANNSLAGPMTFIYAGDNPGFDYTFSYVQHTVYDGIGYMLSEIDAFSDSATTWPQWRPDPRLNQTDADISLFMLAQNGIQYLEPSNDPWMPAHTPGRPTLGGLPTWKRDFDVNLLGCIDQYQVCIDDAAGNLNCIGPASLLNTLGYIDNLGANAAQIASINRFLINGNDRGIPSDVRGRGASALKVLEKVFDNTQIQSPPNQWEIEVTTWFETCLAKEQAFAVEWATEPTGFPSTTPSGQGWNYTPPTSDAAWNQCRNQMVPSSGTQAYQNFSVLGIALTLIIGGIIVVVGMTLDTGVGWFHGRNKGSAYKRDQWHVEENLQLHKAAYYSSMGVLRQVDLPPSSTVFSVNSGIV